MNLPVCVADDLPSNVGEKWQRQFVAMNRQRHEGIWRRTQQEKTKKYSGYKNPKDARWKLVHFIDGYNLQESDGSYRLVIEKPYLWVNTALPSVEMRRYYQRLVDSLQKGGWRVMTVEGRIMAKRGDLSADIRYFEGDEAREKSGKTLPVGYRVLDVEIYRFLGDVSQEERDRPWNILKTGIREILDTGSPTVVTTSNALDLRDYTPFHLELGCGPSIEAGVPPLSYLHKTYAISNPRTHEFKFGEDDDLLERFFADPEGFYKRAALIYSSSLRAHPDTTFYQKIKQAHDKGVILGDIFTNNYDGLVADLGLPERYLRRFDEAHYLPDVVFDERARALVVVGSHADRRKLQERARTSGLRVIYVDPQQYKDADSDEIYGYNIESPQDDDIVVNMTAEAFAEQYLTKLV